MERQSITHSDSVCDSVGRFLYLFNPHTKFVKIRFYLSSPYVQEQTCMLRNMIHIDISVELLPVLSTLQCSIPRCHLAS